MNTSALRKSLHKVANYDRNVGDVLGELHQLMLDMDGSTKSCQQVCTRSKKEHERANLLDDIADRGTDEQVVLWAKAEHKRHSKDSSLRLAERTFLSLSRRLERTA